MTGFPYGSPRWRALRLVALRRARWRCCKCGAGGPRLTVDHIRDVRRHPALAWDLGNLQVLCPAHDNAKHAEKGRGVDVWGVDEAGVPLDPSHSWRRTT